MRILKKLICRIRGHKYLSPTFTGNALYFCDRCGKEMFDRTFADLEPMTEEEQELFFDHELYE